MKKKTERRLHGDLLRYGEEIAKAGGQHLWIEGVPMDPAAEPTTPMPTLPGIPYLHAGLSAVIVGPTGKGRSSLAQANLYDAALADLGCAYLGAEVTVGEFNTRAGVLAERRGDVVDARLRAQIAGVSYLDLSSAIVYAWDHPDKWIEQCIRHYDVIVIDPLSGVASALDLDFDTKNVEFVRFYDRLIQPLLSGGVAVELIDNVGHRERTRAKGASAKSEKVDLAFSCSGSASPAGLFIKTTKVRPICAAFKRGDKWLFTRDDQRITQVESAVDSEGNFRPTNIMQKVSEELELGGGLGVNEIEEAVTSKKDHVTTARRLLDDEGYIENRPEGQKHHYFSLKPYRESYG